MRIPALIAVSIAATLAVPATPCDPGEGEDPGRQFDFWVGEWSVQNRHLAEDGSWREGTTTRARITPVCGAAAILEEWAGPLRGNFMNGFSLRAWDPDAGEWKLVLFWTTDGNAAFGQLSGAFRHGRGEFFVPGTGPQRTRYTFSDALPESVRWDSARTDDGGQSWRTDWIMEFTRTRAAGETTQERLFEVPWTEGSVSPHAEARQLDWMLGEWRGVQTLADGDEREARLSCKLLDKDCLVLDLLRTRDEPSGPWREALVVRGYEARPRRWACWRLSSEDSRLVPGTGGMREGSVVFEGPGDTGGREAAGGDAQAGRLVEYLIRLAEDEMQIELARVGAEGEASVVHSTVLQRTQR